MLVSRLRLSQYSHSHVTGTMDICKRIWVNIRFQASRSLCFSSVLSNDGLTRDLIKFTIDSMYMYSKHEGIVISRTYAVLPFLNGGWVNIEGEQGARNLPPLTGAFECIHSTNVYHYHKWVNICQSGTIMLKYKFIRVLICLSMNESN